MQVFFLLKISEDLRAWLKYLRALLKNQERLIVSTRVEARKKFKMLSTQQLVSLKY